MKLNPAVLDLETESISKHPRPGSPPPVGAAIWLPGGEPTYYAHGHPEKNGVYVLRKKKVKGKTVVYAHNKRPDLKCAAIMSMAMAYIEQCFRCKDGVLGHNIAKFDLPVIEDHYRIKPPKWDKVHDSLFTLFLRDPHSTSLSLKPAAEHWLKEPPEERDEVFEWLAAHGKTTKRIEKGVVKYGSKEDPAAAHIAEAPGDLVAKYAIGDLTRTHKLFEMHQPWVVEQGMEAAYDRERRLAPVLLENERLGIRVDMEGLKRDLPKFEAAFKTAEEWIRKRLKAPGLNIDADKDVAAALKKAKIVKDFPKTPTGKDSVSKKNLTINFFKDKKVYHALQYRNTMATVLVQSLRKWYAEGLKKNGRIYREWHQVRQGHGDNDTKGARSGRVTVSGLANIAKRFGGKDPDYVHPAFMRVPEPPLARDYILPDEGEEFGHCDYDQQEMKITAHYEDGALAEKYRQDPKTDIHIFVHDEIQKVSDKDYNRDVVKQADFLISYGGGAPALADRLRVPVGEAKEVIHHWKKALPDVVELDKELKGRFKEGLHIRTLGGRVYFCKPPIIAKKGPRKGQMMTFEYTALNYLVQPSAADQTKEALILYWHHPRRKGRILCTVYDEINISMKDVGELLVLQECMEKAFKLDVPSTVTAKRGSCWGKLQKIEPKEMAA